MDEELVTKLNETLLEINQDCDTILNDILNNKTYDKELLLKTTSKFIIYKKVANTVVKRMYNSDDANTVRVATQLIIAENRYKMLQKCIQDLALKLADSNLDVVSEPMINTNEF